LAGSAVQTMDISQLSAQLYSANYQKELLDLTMGTLSSGTNVDTRPAPAGNFACTPDTVVDAINRAAFGSSSKSRHFIGIFQTFGGTFLFTVFFTVFCYFIIVTIVNPRRVFWGRSFPEIMPNSRALKLDLLQKYNAARPVELVVLGSSRSMKLSPDLLESITGERTFNAGVFSAAPNDYLSIYRVMKRRRIVPRTLVVGLDAEALDPATTPAPDFDTNLELKSALEGTVPNLPARIWHWVNLYKETLTPYYIEDISKSISIRFNPRPPLFEFQSNGHEEDRILDTQIQSGVYPQAEKVKRCEESLQAKFYNFHNVSPELQSDLKQLLSEATGDKVRVVLWITPVRRETLDKILSDPQAGRNFRNAEAHLVQLGETFNLPVQDLTDSQSFGGHTDSWYDCAHYDQADADKIARKLFTNGL
jgi:hypothetical protein